METINAVNDSLMERKGEPASDHKVLHVRFRPRRQRPQHERGIPAYILKTEFYKIAIDELRRNTEYDDLTAVGKWRALKET